jgi:hypothetical protein
VLQARERASIPSPFVVFIFGLTVESIKELGGASLTFTIVMGGNDAFVEFIPSLTMKGTKFLHTG